MIPLLLLCLLLVCEFGCFFLCLACAKGLLEILLTGALWGVIIGGTVWVSVMSDILTFCLEFS